jgi:hypothetical protein
VILWNGFYDTASIAGWMEGGAGGDWFWQAGTVVEQIASSGERTFTAPPTFQHVAVSTSFVVSAIQSNGLIGICSGIVPATHQYCCVIDQAGPTILATTNGGPVSAPWPGTVKAGDQIQLVENTANGNQCDLSMGAAHATVTSPLGAPNGVLQMYTASAATAYDYLFVVEIGP